MALIDFSLLRPVDVGAQVMQGFQTGRAMVKQAQADNALKAYLANPEDQQAFSALVAYNPEVASNMATVQDRRLKSETMRRELEFKRGIGALAQRDPAAAAQAATGAGEFDIAKQIMSLDDEGQKRSAAFFKAAGPLAFKMRQMKDPAERKAFLDSAKPMLLATGADPAQIDQFDVSNDGALDAIIAGSQTVDQLIDQGKIVWHQVGERPSFATNVQGVPIGNANPYASVMGGAPPVPTNPPAAGPLDLGKAEAVGARFGRVTSTTRTPEHNKRVGGVANSYHLKGQAIDIAREPGVSHHDIEAAYKAQGYRLIESLDEGDHSHFAFAAGPSGEPTHPEMGEADIRASAQAAIVRGADPAAVAERAAKLGVKL